MVEQFPQGSDENAPWIDKDDTIEVDVPVCITVCYHANVILKVDARKIKDSFNKTVDIEYSEEDLKKAMEEQVLLPADYANLRGTVRWVEDELEITKE